MPDYAKLELIKKIHFGRKLTPPEQAAVSMSARQKENRRRSRRGKKKSRRNPLGVDVRLSMDGTGRVVNYPLYLRSQWWIDTRQRKFEEVGKRCERCRAKRHLHVHHLNYLRLGGELLSDLEVLCRDCHQRVHQR